MHSSALSTPESRNDIHLTDLSTDEVAIVFGFLSPCDIMRARVCTSWRDAAKKTIVPLTPCLVDSVRSFNAIRAMSTALPNLQQLSICSLEGGHKYSDGEDAIEALAIITADDTTHDIDMLSNFTKLRLLEIVNAPLNGRYPFLFDLPHIQTLKISDCFGLDWDLDMFGGMPRLTELHCCNTDYLTGSLGDLRVLKNTLEKVRIIKCRSFEGDFMELADFPRLKELDLHDTAMTGDIRNIGAEDFPVLESLSLPKNVIGGRDHEFQQISEVPSFMHTVHLLLQRTPTLFSKESLSAAFGWRLSEDSPDWYDDASDTMLMLSPPFHLRFVRAGSRRGWSWCSSNGGYSCEINWLDPEPSSGSSDYEDYIEETQRIEELVTIYRGHSQPPPEREYHHLYFANIFGEAFANRMFPPIV